ncbi:LAFA_0E21902g1_1 [Lachancea sp. 'fantastica']|nr:LAFA_0E21902g1_1 [Lachancea sp. 'fantastica']
MAELNKVGAFPTVASASSEKSDGNNHVVEEFTSKGIENEPTVPNRFQITKTIVVRKSELMAKQYDAWYMRSLFLFTIFICSFAYGLDSIIRDIYMTYALNAYSTHSLLSTVNVISMVISAVGQIFFARLSDVFGRLSIFIVSIVLYVVGTIIQSQAYDVQRYAAGSVFYNIGLIGALFQVSLILSDSSTLKWRMLYNYLPAWPAVITVWISGNVVQVANPQEHWSWGIAMWAFIFPASCIPMIVCMLHMRWKAGQTAEWKELDKEKSYFQTYGLLKMLVKLFWQLNIIGLILLSVLVGCICVPLTIAGGVSTEWKTAKVIAPFVLGFVLIPVFIFWESKVATVPLAPYGLLKDRGIWAPMWAYFLIAFIYSMAAGYLYTILLVAANESDLSATRISSLYSFVSAVFSPFVGVLVARVARLKPFTILGCSLYFVTMGIFYHFRGGEDAGKGVIGAMVVWGITSCLYDYPISVAIQLVTSHEHLADVSAIIATVFRIGGAIGAAVSGAIWTQTLYPRLLKELGDPDIAQQAYESPYDFIANYSWGTPMREGAVAAYRVVQRYEVIVGLVFVAPMFVITFFLRDPVLDDEYGQKLDGEEYVNKSDDPITDWIVARVPGLRKRNQRH